MKMNLQLAVLGLILLGLLVHATGCVRVESGPNSAPAEQAEVLGGSNGYVLLRHTDGKIYVIDLASHHASEVGGLPQEKKSEMVVY